MDRETKVGLLELMLKIRKVELHLAMMFVGGKLRMHDRNRRLWRARSYAPHLYLGASDARHA